MAFKDRARHTLLDRLSIVLFGPGAETGLNLRLTIFANLLFLAAGIAGMVLVAQGATGTGLLFGVLFGTSNCTMLIEFRKRGRASLDEREQPIAWKSMAIGSTSTCFLVGLWATAPGTIVDEGLWLPVRPSEWQATGLFIFSLMLQITNIASALMTPPYAAELLDES